MPNIGLHISGFDKLEERFRKAIPRARKAAAKATYQFAEEVMADSKAVVPVDTGALMNSGKVLPPTDDGSKISVKMGYGDESVGYALYVHEALEGARPPSPDWSWTKKVNAGGKINWTRPGSGPKYLENPLKAKQNQFPGLVLAAIKDAMRGK